MTRALALCLATAALLAGCEYLPGGAANAMTPKRAAELCNGWQADVAPKEGQKQVVEAFREGQIGFEECMRRLRA